MAWTTPRTWADGELVTAALLNAQLRDNLNELRGGGIAMPSQAALDFVYAASATALGRLAAAAGKVPRVNANGTAWTMYAADVRCIAYHSTTQTIATSTWTTLSLDSEREDPLGMHDLVTNNSRITAPEAGTYLVVAGTSFPTATSNMTTGLRVIRNGAITHVLELRAVPGGFGETRLTVVGLLPCQAADYVEIQAYQNSGGNLAIGGTTEYQRSICSVMKPL